MIARFWHRLCVWATRLIQLVQGRDSKGSDASLALDLSSWSISPDIVAHSLLGALYATLVALQYEQGHLIFELGQTPDQQFQLATNLAVNLYTTGIPPYTSEVVQRYLCERDIQECLWGMMCHERSSTLYRRFYESISERVTYSSPVEQERRQENKGSYGQRYTRSRRGGRGFSLRTVPQQPDIFGATLTADATPAQFIPRNLSTMSHDDWLREWPNPSR